MAERVEYCTGPDCDKPAARDGLCWSHVKQRQRDPDASLRPLAEKLSPFERVIVAGSALLEAEDDDEYSAAKARYRRANEAWLASEGWRPPKGRKAAAVSTPPSRIDSVQLALVFGGERARGASCARERRGSGSGSTSRRGRRAV